MTPGERTMPREPVGLDRVLRGAIELADEGGIETLSMRRLAHHVGLETMSLYHYVRNKDELLGSMLDLVFAAMALPADGPDWRSDIRAAAISARDELIRHPWACSLLASPTGLRTARVEWMDAFLGRLRRAGFSPEMTHHAYHAIDSHIVGFTLWVLPYLALIDDPDAAAAVLQTLPLDRLPYLAEHLEEHAADRPGDLSEFEFGLDLLLEGLDRRRGA